MDRERIRNFSIIAHIDHGKSTLADRILELVDAVEARQMRDQYLDNMDLERERGITIKMKAVRFDYKALDGTDYEFNLIDTPGHVDFAYEVSRSLAACEGVLLVVDASQGIEAQTVANFFLAMDADLEVIPVLNKIDLPSADVERVSAELGQAFDILPEEVVAVSAKEGLGIRELLEAVVERIPSPGGDPEAPLKALVFDSHYDSYRGVVPYIRLFDGGLEPGVEIKMMATGKVFEVSEVGVFTPAMKPAERLGVGEVGYFIANVKEVKQIRIGDTVTGAERSADKSLPGYRPLKPMVFCSLFPTDASDYPQLRDALDKLVLNDAALIYEPETSAALNFGFRCGFLGLLHMEIVQERLEREYNLDLVATAPSVAYKIQLVKGDKVIVNNPKDFPDPAFIEHMEEPIVNATIMVPTEHVGAVMELCEHRRGQYRHMEYLGEKRVLIHYEMPLNEIIYDFFDHLKAATRGFASLDYEHKEYRRADLVKMDILIHHQPVDALAIIVNRERAYYRGRAIAEKLKELIPRHMFEVPIQAAIGGNVLARETVRAMRKNVTAKCYGGDVTRKRKLLERQKEGKKRLKQIGQVSIPQEAFISVLKIDRD